MILIVIKFKPYETKLYAIRDIVSEVGFLLAHTINLFIFFNKFIIKCFFFHNFNLLRVHTFFCRKTFKEKKRIR